MTRIKKASKTNRNQPAEFNETLAAPFAMSARVAAQPGLTNRQIRLGIGTAWVVAAVFAGIGIGRIINDAASSQASTQLAVPVATANVSATATVSGSIGRSESLALSDIKITPAEGVLQAHSGNVVATVATAGFQPAQPSDALQPGYTHFLKSQGNIGTLPVR